MTGRTIAHYAITEKLGEGGMGVVYKARDKRLERFVALKVLPAGMMTDPERRPRFEQEAKSASALNHPNIVTIYDIGQAEDIHFIAMEYIEGKTLDALIGPKGLGLKEALTLAVQIADGLGKAHAAGLVHRDLKPSNIMVTPDGLVKLLDFGLAKLVEKADAFDDISVTRTLAPKPVTEEGKIVGTVAYMSPEQAEGKPVDARSDIFSFGSVLYEMLTGRRAFAGETKASTMAAVIALDPMSPSGVSTPLPADVERTVMRCLRKDPQRRWQNMSDLKVALQDLKEESDSGKLSATLPAAPGPARRRTWPLFALAGLVVLAAAGVMSWLLLKPRGTPPAVEPERITFESGGAFLPAISPDGKLIAYASDRDGNFDIYVRQLSGRESVRRTTHPAPDWFPSFSPDGSKIVFRSERDGGGIYMMESLGGAERRIADEGRLPAFSPDGKSVAFLVATPLTRLAKLFVVPAGGGDPTPLQPEFVIPGAGASWSWPLWSADGTHVLFSGYQPQVRDSLDWWLAPVAGGPAVRVKAPPRSRQFVRLLLAWRNNYLYFSEGSTVGGMGLYRVPFSQRSRRLGGPPQLLTSPIGMQYGASMAADGRMVFSTTTSVLNVWSVPLKSSDGTAAGPPQPVTTDPLGKLSLAVAADGSRLAWSSYSEKQTELRVRETATGREEAIAGSGKSINLFPVLSPDGSRLAYSDLVEGKRVAYIAEGGAAPRPAPGIPANGIVFGFLPKSGDVLVLSGNQLARQDVAGARSAALLDTTSAGELWDAALSPSGRSLAFTIARADGSAGLYVAGVGDKPAPAEAWTMIEEGRQFIGSPAWSADSRILYYGSNRDDFFCVWGQRFAPDGQPAGEPFAAFHDHQPPDMKSYGICIIRAARDRLYMLLADFKGDLWSLQLPR